MRDSQHMVFALGLFGLRLLTSGTWTWWFSLGHGGGKLNPGGISGSGSDGGHQRFKHYLALLARRKVV